VTQPILIDNPDTLIIAAGSDAISLGIAAPVDTGGLPMTITLTDVPADGVVEYWNGDYWQTAQSGDTLTADELASLTYTPSSGAHGVESLSYFIGDGVSKAGGSIDISVIDGAGGGDIMYFSATSTGNIGPDLFSFTTDGGPVADPVRFDGSAQYGSSAGEDGGFANFGGALYFNAFSTSTGDALMKVSPDGGVSVVEGPSGGHLDNGGFDANFTEFNGSLYFRAFGDGGDELFSVDRDGTTRGWDVNPGDSNNGSPGQYGGFAVFDGALYFSANSSGNNDNPDAADLMRLNSDGTLENLALRTGPNAAYGSFAGEDGGYAVFNNALYFNAYTDSTGDTLFKLAAGSDVAVAVDALEIDHTDAGQIDSAFHVFDDKLYFNDFSATIRAETLFQIDTSGTLSAILYNSEALENAGARGGFVDLGDSTYFLASTGETGLDLFKLNTSGEVTALDVNPGGSDLVDDNMSANMVAFNGSLYIDGYDVDYGGDYFYKIDQDGTISVVDLGEATENAGATGFQVFDGKLYFEANTADGVELVSIDTDGNIVTTDINDGGSSNPGDPGGFGVLAGPAFDGGDASDILAAGSVDTSLSGGGGDDLLRSGFGNDTLDGGTGIDTASYENAQGGVDVDLGGDRDSAVAFGSAQEGSAHGAAGEDTLIGIENVIGSDWDDQITGDGAANSLAGAGGDDTFYASGGQDTLNGGEGFDTVDYSDSAVGVTVNLTSGYGTDILVSIEQVFGSQHDDVLVAGAGYSELYGDYGDDHLFAAGNGANGDWLDGGEGIDTADYSNATTGVTAELDGGKRGAPAPGSFDGDVLVNIENLVGSDFSDHLTGNEADNVLTGGAGDDALIGLDGNDTLYGGDGDDTLYGGPGDDHFDGGTGVNTVSFNGVSAGETVDLAAGTATGSAGGADTLVAIQNVGGSLYGDVISGDLGANLLDGDHGDDHLFGLGGADTLVGGQGSDTLAGGYGADVLTGAVGNDTFVFGSVGEVRSGEDLITDLTNNDVIDLSGLDAKGQKPGHQAFHLVDAFDGHKAEMTVSYDADSNRTLLLFDTNKDGVGDMSIAISGNHTDFSHFIF
jgi:Ca2+-binding RTX toxin-like protein